MDNLLYLSFSAQVSFLQPVAAPDATKWGQHVIEYFLGPKLTNRTQDTGARSQID